MDNNLKIFIAMFFVAAIGMIAYGALSASTTDRILELQSQLEAETSKIEDLESQILDKQEYEDTISNQISAAKDAVEDEDWMLVNELVLDLKQPEN